MDAKKQFIVYEDGEGINPRNRKQIKKNVMEGGINPKITLYIRINY